MKAVLVTGSDGFVGKNLVATLAQKEGIKILGFDCSDDVSHLSSLVAEADFIFHLAGVNRPQDNSEFFQGNASLTQMLVDSLHKLGKSTPIVLTSSIQAALDNPYGVSKSMAEGAVFDYHQHSGAPAYVFRLPNLFGKWCRPNYNSVVATFCHNVARELPIQVNDPQREMNLVYIDDLLNAFIDTMEGRCSFEGEYASVDPVHTIPLGELAKRIKSFKTSRSERSIPDMGDALTKKLYATYLSYLPTDQFSYPLQMHEDHRGSFAEIIKTADRGQVSINISKPGITKGNHWHHTKNEKFLVVSGQGVIRFRKIGSTEVIEYPVSADKLEVVDIPTGYTHNITNTGTQDMATLMWCNEIFDPENPDTNPESV